MRRLLALAALLLLALPASAAPAPFLAALKAGDTDLNQPLTTFTAKVGYLDGNVNGSPDAAAPDENVYLDLDGSTSVSYGDLRLTPFDTYAAGTVVDLANRDVGRALASVDYSVWFAHAGESWYLDMDSSRTVSVGDVRMAATAPGKVHAGDAALGTPLARPDGARTGSLGWWGSGPRNPTGALYVDIDIFSTGNGRTSAGDLRLTPAGFAPDDAPTRAEFEQAQHAGTQTVSASGSAAPPASFGSAPSAWRALDWLLVGLAVLNLAGLVAVARRLEHLRGPPRNPFK
jgi:hypothetical protein